MLEPCTCCIPSSGIRYYTEHSDKILLENTRGKNAFWTFLSHGIIYTRIYYLGVSSFDYCVCYSDYSIKRYYVINEIDRMIL